MCLSPLRFAAREPNPPDRAGFPAASLNQETRVSSWGCPYQPYYMNLKFRTFSLHPSEPGLVGLVYVFANRPEIRSSLEDWPVSENCPTRGSQRRRSSRWMVLIHRYREQSLYKHSRGVRC